MCLALLCVTTTNEGSAMSVVSFDTYRSNQAAKKHTDALKQLLKEAELLMEADKCKQGSRILDIQVKLLDDDV
jgi:hypothetical protein